MENQETTQVTVITNPELNAVVTQNSSVELNKAQSHAVAFAPSMNKIHELSQAIATMNKENPTEADAKLARRCRLDLVPVRTGADKIKKELKAGLVVEEKLIDSLFNVIKHTSELAEAEYEKIEKHAENKEKERKEKLKNERLAILSEHTEQAEIYPLSEMEESSFNDLVDAMKLQKEAKEKALQEAESARIEAEKQAELARIEAQRVADEKAEAQRLENIRLKAENDLKEKQLAAERLKAENERKAEAEKQANIQKRKDAELAKQKKENEAIQKQLQAKKDAELLREKQLKSDKEKEEKRLLELSKAPDKEKMKEWLFVVVAKKNFIKKPH